MEGDGEEWGNNFAISHSRDFFFLSPSLDFLDHTIHVEMSASWQKKKACR